MNPGFVQRMILLKACIVRRTSRASWISSEDLCKAVQEDQELVSRRTPDYYFQDCRITIGGEISGVVEDGLIEESGGGRADGKRIRNLSGNKYQRTHLGDIFLKSLEPTLASILDEMPMSGEDLLDFLSRL